MPGAVYLHTKVMTVLAKKQRIPTKDFDNFNINFRDVVLKTINQYRIEVVYSTIAFIGSAILFFQYQSTQNFAWFISLTLFCSKMAIGIINYEQYCQSNKRSMKIALKYLLFKFV